MADKTKVNGAGLVAGTVTFDELEEAVRIIGPVRDGDVTRSPEELIGCIRAFRESPTHLGADRIAAAHGVRRQAVGIMSLELLPVR